MLSLTFGRWKYQFIFYLLGCFFIYSKLFSPTFGSLKPSTQNLSSSCFLCCLSNVWTIMRHHKIWCSSLICIYMLHFFLAMQLANLNPSSEMIWEPLNALVEMLHHTVQYTQMYSLGYNYGFKGKLQFSYFIMQVHILFLWLQQLFSEICLFLTNCTNTQRRNC